MAASVSDHGIHGSPSVPAKFSQCEPSEIPTTDSPLPSHRDQVLINHLARNQLDRLLENLPYLQEDEEVTDGNVLPNGLS
jgi:hypothetical protein